MSNKRYKILMVIDKEKIGGVKTAVFGMAKELVAKGFEVYLLAGLKEEKFNQKTKYKETNGIKIFYYPVIEKNYYWFTYSILKGVGNRLQQLSGENKFELVHLHLPPSALAVFLSDRLKNVPKLFHVHGIRFREVETGIMPPKRHQVLGGIKRGFQFFPKILLEKYLQQFCLRQADLIITPSLYSQREISKYFKIDPQKIKVLNNAVDQSFFKPSSDHGRLKKKLKLEKNWPVLLTSSRLERTKGLEEIIKAMPEILKKLPKAKLVMAFPLEMESDLYYQSLVHLVESLDLKNHLVFKVNSERKELLSLYQVADGFLNTSQFTESFSLSLVEALSCGTSGLTTPVGGPQEILKPLNQALILKGTDCQHLAKGVINFFSQNPREINSLRKRTHAYARRFSAKKQIIKLMTIYETLINKPKAKG